jgi:non-heme chloroperoxidase
MLTCRTNGIAPAERGGQAVLLLHAFPVSSEMWQQQLEALEKASIPAIAPNAYGIEGSEEKKTWTFEEYARELAVLLDSLGCRKATVAGLSMGGYQAFAFYGLFPERTASLVLCDTRAEADKPEAAKQRLDFIEAVEKEGAGAAVKRMIPNYFTPETFRANPSLARQAEAMIMRQSPAAIMSAMKAIMNRRDSTPMLARIACPVLVINGLEDSLTTAETARSIAGSIPGAELELIAGAAHLSNMEQPEKFNQALLDHVRRTAGT